MSAERREESAKSAARGAAIPDTRRKHPVWLPAAAAVATILLRLLGATWRVDRRGLAALDQELAGGARCIYALWHSRMLPLVWTHRGRGAVVLVSRHGDGEWIARVIHGLGYRAVRGSSTRGGDEATRGLLAAAEQGRSLVVTPDGPRGPAERVKPGVVWLASRSGLPIFPVASSADRAHVFRSWDRFRVPLPFARVVVAYGNPIAVPRGLDEAQLETWRDRVEQELASVTQRVAAEAGERA